MAVRLVVADKHEVGPRIHRSVKCLYNCFRNAFDNRHDDGISKLPVSLGVRNRYLHVSRIAHEFGAFAGGETPGIFAGALENQDFRTVLVVARTQGPRNVIAGEKSEAETVARRLVLLGVVLQILPEVVRQRVFFQRVRFKDGGQLRPLFGEFWKFKIMRFPETDQKDAFAVLRHDALCINDLVINGVTQRFGQGVVNDFKCPALVVVSEIFDILQNERGGLMVFENVGNLEKEVALLLVVKAVLPAKAQFLGYARDAERLAGKACTENVMRGNVRDGHLMNVPVRFFAKISLIGDLGVFVPIRGKHAFAACPLKCEAKTADSAKKVNETEVFLGCQTIHLVGGRALAQCARAIAGASKIRFFVFCSGHDKPTRILSLWIF